MTTTRGLESKQDGSKTGERPGAPAAAATPSDENDLSKNAKNGSGEKRAVPLPAPTRRTASLRAAPAPREEKLFGGGSFLQEPEETTKQSGTAATHGGPPSNPFAVSEGASNPFVDHVVPPGTDGYKKPTHADRMISTRQGSVAALLAGRGPASWTETGGPRPNLESPPGDETEQDDSD